MGDAIAVHGRGYLDWTFHTFSPRPLQLTLEELGYPVGWLYRTWPGVFQLPGGRAHMESGRGQCAGNEAEKADLD